ncbi:MAG: CPBP family intramembrane metalloprotease [Candidatus Rokubacteria bacterium]|nr:CPBP family intramembrane metalloprotease [Candidatus Rokubacteria bacterium]
MEPVKPWVVFLTYGLAVVGVLLFSALAGMVLFNLDPDLKPDDLGLRGVIAGAVASSMAFGFATVAATRGMPASRIRVLPGRERGRDLLAMVVGVLALGQALDSAATLAGLGREGAMERVRRALQGASGGDLFAAVIVIGVMAGVAEELFFRGYMQSLLRERWRPGTAAVVTSLCFSVLHPDPVHATLAFVLALYLGFVTEMAGSALPAATCHVVNNIVFTLLTTLVAPITRAAVHQALLAVCVIVFVAAVVWLRRSLGGRASGG